MIFLFIQRPNPSIYRHYVRLINVSVQLVQGSIRKTYHCKV
uniref:Uncharacterized protein n=1 Tax=Lepeophtheirus salmonis TaxID=72036 RepID=A0A0K2U3X7_LEPSM